ncbi:ArsR family transcriptional regulator [Streptomyces monashensis]|nr:helix-turn-helix domain-containing protein [Streptomyces monashensis]
MQAVCWVQLQDAYRPARAHGPRKVGETTLRIAVELARLSPCRPGVGYLVRILKLSERTIQYHLAILREAGLLAYRSKGTRVAKEGGRASEFVRVIPEAFDTALHLTTRPCLRLIRTLTGIGQAGRSLMKRLARTAQKVMRRPRLSPARASRPSRCTPKGGSADSSSSAGVTTVPPESKLEHGKYRATAPNKPKPGAHRSTNHVGRRFQLARELIVQVDWLRGCSVPRIAWVIRNVADAGWTAQEVRGWLHFRCQNTARIRRASGFLATLLHRAEEILDTPAKRTDAVAQWQTATEAARRHRIQTVRQRSEHCSADWLAPSSHAVQRLVADAIAATLAPSRHDDALSEPATSQNLTDADLQVLRATARAEYMQGETALITSAVEILGRPSAEAMYGPDLVHRALLLAKGLERIKVHRSAKNHPMSSSAFS